MSDEYAHMTRKAIAFLSAPDAGEGGGVVGGLMMLNQDITENAV